MQLNGDWHGHRKSLSVVGGPLRDGVHHLEPGRLCGHQVRLGPSNGRRGRGSFQEYRRIKVLVEHCAPEPDRSFVLSLPDGDVVLSLTMDGPVLGKDGQNILPILDLTVGDQAQQPIGDDFLGPWLNAHAVE